ncbi:hypothetical protein ACFWHW_31390 [Streptomyces pharetrae]|uniref:DUF7691 family protein n=1 Tax=Streptomyces pharetrae TaxID=291370 RepID=UPI00364BF3A6
MGSSLSVYLLDVAATRALVGCRDDTLLEVIRDNFADDLARDDEEFGYGGLPAPLPYTFTPGCGEWTPQQTAQALDQFEATKRAVDEAGQAPPPEPEVVEAVMQCLGWMRHAVARPGFGVTGFRS